MEKKGVEDKLFKKYSFFFFSRIIWFGAKGETKNSIFKSSLV